MRREPDRSVTAPDWLARELAATAAHAEEEVSALLAAANGGELPATTDASGVERAWRAVERDAGDEWVLVSLVRLDAQWEATARHKRHGEAILLSGRTPGFALNRLAEVLRRT